MQRKRKQRCRIDSDLGEDYYVRICSPLQYSQCPRAAAVAVVGVAVTVAARKQGDFVLAASQAGRFNVKIYRCQVDPAQMSQRRANRRVLALRLTETLF